jgi:hypothetical protein
MLMPMASRRRTKNFAPRERERRLATEGGGGTKVLIAVFSLEVTLRYKVKRCRIAHGKVDKQDA